MDEKSKCKTQEYNVRYRFWSDKRISQFSFHNNLLLTVGIAAIGYFWKERDSVYKTLIIDFHSYPDWKVLLFFVGIVILFLSVLAGFVLSLSRLYDLRLTAEIVITRRRLAEKAINLKDENLSPKGFFSSIKSLWSVLWNYPQYKIAKTCVKADERDLQKKFTLPIRCIKNVF